MTAVVIVVVGNVSAGTDEHPELAALGILGMMKWALRLDSRRCSWMLRVGGNLAPAFLRLEMRGWAS